MSQGIKIYIVEDDPLIAESIKVGLEKEGYEVIGMAMNGGDAYFEIEELCPDLAILDITIEGKMSGIDLGNKLGGKLNIPFIYLTSHGDKNTVREALESQPAGYLLKPFRAKDLAVAIDLALSKQTTQEPTSKSNDCFFVKHKKQWVKIKSEEILFAKADDNYTEIITSDQTYLISQPLKSIEEKLPSSDFIRVHRSYLVNLNHINGYEDDVLLFEKHSVPVSKSFKKDLLDRLNFL